MKAVYHYDIAQNSPEWMAVRAGIPTASEFDTVMASGRGGGESKTRRKYMLRLIAERMGAQLPEPYTNASMERGHEMEAEARRTYAFINDCEPTLVGFVRNGDVGASPDALVGDKGLLEVKTKQPDIHLEVLLAGVLPPEHKAQVQGQLWVCEREFCDFVSYWPKLPPFIIRVYRDEAYITTLANGVAQFMDELLALQARVSA